jgi:hypothetical protein
MKRINLLTALALLAAMICLSLSPLSAQKKEQQTAIRVFVFVASNSNGFSDPGQKDRNDSLEDLKKDLGKKLIVTDRREDADVTVELVGRGYQNPQTVGKTARAFGDATGKNRVATVSVTIAAGDYSATIDGQNDGRLTNVWRTAAGDTAKKIEAWVQDNREKLLSRRTK